MRKIAVLLFVLCFSSAFPFCLHAEIAYNFTSLIYGTDNPTYAYGIDGNKIVGEAGGYGFLYSGGVWNVLNHPSLSYPYLATAAYGIDGDRIVGAYVEPFVGWHGFVHDGSNWQTYNYPGAINTQIHDIDGSNMVGVYEKSSVEGILYDGSTWTWIHYPGAHNTYVWGVSGNNIVGHYEGAGAAYSSGFIYDINNSSFTSLTYPGATATYIRGIDGNDIVGYYWTMGDTVARHGFIYNSGTDTWQSIDYPSGLASGAATWAYGIDNGNIVGGFYDGYNEHGFLAAPVPIPSALFLFAPGFVGLLAVKKRFGK